jgi:hypothetical protein
MQGRRQKRKHRAQLPALAAHRLILEDRPEPDESEEQTEECGDRDRTFQNPGIAELKNLFGWVRLTFEGLMDMILPPWPNLLQVIQSKTVEGEKQQPGDFPLIQEAALQYAHETLEERIETCESDGDFVV